MAINASLNAPRSRWGRWSGCRNGAGLIGWMFINRPLREIQNYTNERKTAENIPFEIKKIIDSKGMDSEGMEGKLPKIFGSNSKVSNPKVNPIRSEWIPSENIRFKIQKF